MLQAHHRDSKEDTTEDLLSREDVRFFHAIASTVMRDREPIKLTLFACRHIRQTDSNPVSVNDRREEISLLTYHSLEYYQQPPMQQQPVYVQVGMVLPLGPKKRLMTEISSWYSNHLSRSQRIQVHAVLAVSCVRSDLPSMKLMIA